MEVMYFTILFFKVSMNLLAKTDLLSLCIEHNSIAIFCNHDFIDILSNSVPLSTHILFDFLLDLFAIF